jgi:phage shock protein PspC (stress-responsive transcriptional regulator)
VAGVAGGLAERLRVDPAILRVAFVLLALCAGAGVLAYAVLWVSLPQAETPVEVLDAGSQRGIAVALVLAGVVVALRSTGLWVGDTVAWSVGLVALGIAVLWLRGNDTERARWSRLAQQAPASMLEAVAERGPVNGIGKVRLLIGVVASVGGMVVFLARSNLARTQPGIVAAVAVTAVGVGLVAGPWGWRLVRALGDERRERIRSEERAEVAAHLHDSVLQTLALIQRTDQPRDMVALARNQERELRAWLSARPPVMAGESETVATAVEKAAASVELQFKVPVEVVTVGDTPLDDRPRPSWTRPGRRR